MIVYGDNVKIQVPALLLFYDETDIFNERNFKIINDFNASLDNKYNLYFIDIKFYNNLTKSYNVSHYPSIIVFDDRSKEINRFYGNIEKNLILFKTKEDKWKKK